MLKLLDNRLWLFFVKYPSIKLHVRALAKKIGVSPTSVINYSESLLDKELINEHPSGKNRVLSPNYDNEKFIFFKKWTNLVLLIESGVIEELSNESRTIILFGSYSKGEDIERSDIDIAIDKPTKNNLEKYENLLSRNIQLHYMQNLKNLNLKENIKQGILIKGIML
ncbi:MAG: nucleotidyltransferase domain-containing protein [Nanoarchaeota archaeon]|nr:nucleotidyltransferase domain-containing protein [Nanoarchaeota archaeon]